MTVTAASLALHLDAVLHGDGTVALNDLSHDSRSVGPGSLFCCIPGASFDGHDFASAAVSAGTSALLVEHRLTDSTVADVPQLEVPAVREALGPAACFIHDNPSRDLAIVGVTGTNGKTTIVTLLGDVLRKGAGPEGGGVEVFGTLTGARTTPEAPELQARLAAARHRGTKWVAMEVSSHSLDMRRVDGTRFAVSVFTNLGHDHLDHHHTIEEYYLAKARLFTPDFTELAIINVDDPMGARLANESRVETITYGLSDAADLVIDGPISRFRWRDQPITLQLAGSHNVRNALAAAMAAEALGFAPVDIADALVAAVPPRGRFEFVNVGQAFAVVVDYAHTPDALEAALAAAREVAGGAMVSVVFGCGGDRDQQKRPVMGQVAAAGADRVYVTSDNPRHENPALIIEQILAGIEGGADHSSIAGVTASRAEAITNAVADANPGDVLLIAGKGHEVEQVIGDTVRPFDDREVAISAIGATT